jgi:hypothetical protein
VSIELIRVLIAFARARMDVDESPICCRIHWHTSCARHGMTKTRRHENESNPAQSAPRSRGDTTVAETERERVAQRAYELDLERGRGDGQAIEDWLSAERELVSSGRSSSDGREH